MWGAEVGSGCTDTGREYTLKLAGMTEVVNSHLVWDVPTLPPATLNTLPQWTQERASILIVRATVSMTPARAVAQVIATILIVWPGKMMVMESVTRFVANAWACTTNAGCAMVQEQFWSADAQALRREHAIARAISSTSWASVAATAK